jgi:hypothetical protein
MASINRFEGSRGGVRNDEQLETVPCVLAN